MLSINLVKLDDSMARHMNRVLAFTIAFITIVYGLCWSTIINVPGDYPTIQHGIDASTDGDTVLVQPGTYVENVNFNGHNIVLGSLFLTTGDTSYISTTVIDGDATGSVVTFESGEDSTSIIIGLTLTNGFRRYEAGGILCSNNSCPLITRNIISNNVTWYWPYEEYGDGGGIACLSGSNPLISANIIIENLALFRGGGIFCENSDPTICNNIILGNMVGPGPGGGGIACVSSNPIIADNSIKYNIVGQPGSGGGIYLRNSNGIIENNSVIGNENEGISCSHSNPAIIFNVISENYGGRHGGISCGYSNSLIYNNIISSNSANNTGGGIYIYNRPSPIIVKNTIIGNSASNVGGGVGVGYAHPFILNNVISGNDAGQGGGFHSSSEYLTTIVNTIIWGNSGSQHPEIYLSGNAQLEISYSDILGGWDGEGNIDVDPLFRDPEDGDFHLMSSACGDPFDSPCIDAGDPDISDSLLDCSWGLGELRSDMGAYGGGDSVLVEVDYDEMPMPDRFSVSQNYPNPFNTATVIRYNLPEASDVTIDIFDILGRKVETLIEGKQPGGYHQVVWNAGKRSSGMYFYRIKAGEYSETKKMVLLK